MGKFKFNKANLPKIFRRIDDDSYEFKPTMVEIEERPQNPLGKTILWTIVCVIVFFILWLCLAKVDIVVSATGKVVPTGEIKILKPLENGVISQILVKEGQKVKKGEALILIDPSVSEVDLETKKQMLEALNSSIKRLNALSNGANATLSGDEQNLFMAQNSDFLAKKSALKENIIATKDEISRLQSVLKFAKTKLANLHAVRDIIARKDYDEARINVSDNELKLSIQESKLNELQNNLTALENEMKTKWLDELLAKQKEANALSSEINAIEFRKKQQIISSPVEGYVGKLLINTQGSAVNSTEQLISVIPSDENLIIRANVLNKDVGFLELKQKVAIKIDTFNFQKYGKLGGELIHISNDSIKDEKLGEIYEIKVNPTTHSLIVDGARKEIEPGMSVVAEVKVGKRRVIELFIYPIIRYLDEGLSVR